MLLSTETDLESVWQREMNNIREVSLFVEELSENTESVNAPEIEKGVGEDDSDETFEWLNDSEVEKLDDILFDENVDEVEVEVGAEAEEGEVKDELRRLRVRVRKVRARSVRVRVRRVRVRGELGAEIGAEKVDEGEESVEDLNQVVDDVTPRLSE
ncbi:WD40/YVTN repeat-like-containing domain [Striga asiatica]|uniref:WD40/YVTN repeat-like-containing domain n=1 Tax=Striga asiatica TaxID=4170 RepID=A0A5A7QPB7_STRAF|nr:WD40/YVTN repeat-like-containing domain [Striga asiatica]